MLKDTHIGRGLSRQAREDAECLEAARQAAAQLLARRIGKIVISAGEDLSGPGYLRNSKRVAVKRVGVIALRHGGTVDCMVEDFSVAGFRLELFAEAALPPVFILIVPALRRRFIVARRWVNGLAIGVEIRRRMDLPAGAAPAPTKDGER